MAMKRELLGPAAWALATLAAAVGANPARAAEDGQQLFRRFCFVCHDTEPGKNKIGPSLAGILGRPSASIEGFNYSTAMQSAHLTWDEKTLDTYLTDPKALVPGTKMLFPGVKNADERHALIEYLKSLKS